MVLSRLPVLHYFYHALRMEGDLTEGITYVSDHDISTHALRMEGDLPRPDEEIQYLSISTHALTWRATKRYHAEKNGEEFLPTPSHGGRPRHWGQHVSVQSFYPRPHMEGDVVLFGLFNPLLVISTHALTWRATLVVFRQNGARYISTHALTWRATSTGRA